MEKNKKSISYNTEINKCVKSKKMWIIAKFESSENNTIYLIDDKVIKKKIVCKLFYYYEDFKIEYEIARNLKNENILKSYGDIKLFNKYGLKYEYIKYDLDDYLYHFNCKKNPKDVKYILKQILNGLLYFHENEFAHCDIKPKNILLSEELKVKICDFDISRKVKNGYFDYIPNSIFGTSGYISPEIIIGIGRYTQKVDIWGVGCIFAEMILKNQLFINGTNIEMLDDMFKLLGTPTDYKLNGKSKLEFFKKNKFKIEKGSFYEKFKNCKDKLAIDLLSKMLVINPEKRISCKNAILHPFFVIKKNV